MDLRQFIFFDQADHVLFVRTDAETAEWQVDELSLTCLFPYDPERLITRGMRIGFEDDDGNLQPFEVRKVRNYEPDETQELTCEHIVISELTDIHTKEAELTNASPSSALSTVLGNQPLTMTKKWAVGNVSATATSSGDIGLGSIWQNIRTVEQNWNVYILPRVTFNSGGITGRYLDIVPAQGVWHGLRLSLDKNADEAGITIDDTEVKTALFGYGGTAYEINNEHTDPLDKSSTKITLVGYNWPGHPAGAEINYWQGYIVDTAATNNYGRNGQPRFGFYQNSDITDQTTLAQKTWEALQSVNKPRVTVDCMVRDLYRMGYHDEKIRLHDTALVELLPMNDVLQLEIIKLSVNLLDPTATRPTIGAYIPNIVYIQRETAREASGGVSGKLSGRVGSSQTNTEAEWSEFVAGIDANNMLISLHAAQVDHDNNVLKAAGLDINANGVIIYATDNVNMIGSRFNQTSEAITLEVTNRQNADNVLDGKISVEAGKITQIVTAVGANGEVTAASIVTAINSQGQSAILLSAEIIDIDGVVTALEAKDISGGNFHAEGYITTLKYIYAEDYIYTDETLSAAKGVYGSDFYFGAVGSGTSLKASAVGSIGPASASGGVINIPWAYIDGTAGTPVNFNIAATQYFIDEMAAAELRGWNAACAQVMLIGNTVYGPVSGSQGTKEAKFTANYSASSYTASSYTASRYSASSHSHSSAWMKVDGHTYWSDKTVSLSNYTGNAQFNSGYDSYTASSYTASTYTASSYRSESYSASSFSWTTH